MILFPPVNHFILFMYIAHLSFGVAGVASMAMLHYRIRHAISGPMLWAMSCLLASVFLTMVQYYFLSSSETILGFAPLQYGLGIAIAFALYGGLFLLMLRAPGVPKLATLLMTAFVLAVQAGRVLVLLLASPEAAASFRAPAVALISLYLLFLGWMLYRAAALEPHELMAILLKRVGVLTLIFAPSSTLFYIISYRFPAVERLHISLDYIYFSLWSLIVITVFLRYLSNPTALIEEGKVSDAFISAYKITKRETEVVELISLGLSNQQIADKMYVSLTTVRTHIYNIFQKTGATSRVHLLRMVSGYRQ
jgi:DNA-binding CsgD family transcriptional regulator